MLATLLKICLFVDLCCVLCRLCKTWPGHGTSGIRFLRIETSDYSNAELDPDSFWGSIRVCIF